MFSFREVRLLFQPEVIVEVSVQMRSKVGIRTAQVGTNVVWHLGSVTSQTPSELVLLRTKLFGSVPPPMLESDEVSERVKMRLDPVSVEVSARHLHFNTPKSGHAVGRE